jgi:ABC-type multidrug transport system ATPase subunit
MMAAVLDEDSRSFPQMEKLGTSIVSSEADELAIDVVELGDAKPLQSGRRSTVSRSSFVSKPDGEARGDVLRWTGVNMSLLGSDGRTVQKQILNSVWGEARPFETTAIMGASGAGKTSLFSVLSGRLPHNPKIQIERDIRVGDVQWNSANADTLRKRFAFVGQDDVLHTSSTPREAIRFSAKLRLPSSTTDEEIEDLVRHYLAELKLNKCADSIIGGGLRKGISGGEKRRTSVGVELVTDPTMIFLDEPTSGLDSFAAKQMMILLRKVACAGNTVLFTIHQPSSRTFLSFDKLILIHSGQLMHIGSTGDVFQAFAERGFPVPEHVNPADFILVGS